MPLGSAPHASFLSPFRVLARSHRRMRVARAEQRIPRGELLITRSDNGGTVFCKLGMALGIKSEELLDRRGVGEVDRVLSMASEFFEAAKKEDLYANSL